MAAKREKEETELKAPLCTPPQTISAPQPPQPQLLISRSTDPKLSGGACDSRATSAAASSSEKPDPTVESASSSLKKRPRDSGRCSGSGCRKRVGLIGFRCRCGEVFCSEHRYSDRHECGYDYKAAGREAIAKENPVVRAAKLLKV